SAAAQLAVLPITLAHFNQLSTVGLVANLGVVPLAGAATVLGLVAVALSLFSEAVAAVAFDAVWPLLLALRGIVALAAAVPGAVVHLPAPPPLAVASYVGGLALLVFQKRLAAAILLAVALGAGAWPLVRPPDARLRVTVLDVGQGDAIVAEMPDGGLVLRVEVGRVSFLLASDIEAARERELVDAGLPLATTVLKVAHHGSRSSSTAEFVRAVRPAVAVISVGARNAYGHPDPGVLARLAEAGARIYRTDRDGAVILETDGHTLIVTRWASRRVDRICVDPEAI